MLNDNHMGSHLLATARRIGLAYARILLAFGHGDDLDGAAGTADSSKALGLNCGHEDLIGCALGHGFCGDNRNLAFYPRV